MEAFFQRYRDVFNRALGGGLDVNEASALYASEFIAASPKGVATGKNDEALRQAMAQGYARYRAMGLKEMRLRDVQSSPIGDLHAIAKVGWTAIYARADKPDLALDFDIHYFVQMHAGAPKVFGWVSGDEEDLLRRHGVI